MADDFQEDTTPFEAFASKAGQSVPILGAPYEKAVAYLESLSPFFSIRHAERGEGATQKTYPQALADEQALMAQRAAEHPGWTTGGEITGNLAGYAALPASSMASLPAAMATTGGVSALDKLARGGSPTDVFESGVGGAIGGGAGYVGGKALSKALGKTADWMGIRAAGGTTAPNYKDIKNVASTLGLEPGGFAALEREQGVIGGPKNLSKVAERAGAAKEHVVNLFNDVIRQVDEAGHTIPVEDVLSSIEGASKKGKARDELGALTGESGQLTHGQLQDWLATRSDRASGIANALAKKDNVSAGDRAFYRIYRAGRDLQDKALENIYGGAGEDARTLRRLMALNSTIERTAKNRGEMLASQHPLGLLGSLGSLSGAAEVLHGNAGYGLPLLAGSLLGKATAPYRANVLTSALSIPQQGLEHALAGGVPQVLGATLGRKVSSKGKPGAVDDFEPDVVAGKGQ
jgi:hypothetical protein